MLSVAKNEVAIVGVGTSERFGFKLGKDKYRLAAEALKSALGDCGLAKDEIDGLFPVRLDYDMAARVLGLNVNCLFQSLEHARTYLTIPRDAIMALAFGFAKYAAIIFGTDWGSEGMRFGGGQGPFHGGDQLGELREGGGPNGEDPAYGMTSIGAMYAMMARRYFHLYGASSLDLARVAVAEREWALLNHMAVMKAPITIENHQQSRLIVEPLRLLDCCITTDGAVCVILTTGERAKDLKKSPVYIAGVSPVSVTGTLPFRDMVGLEEKGHQGPREKVTFENVGMAYSMAGVSASDIGALYCYDAFTLQVLFCLEQGGFCGVGEAAQFIADGRTKPGGGFPVNPNGGLLSEAHCGLLNHLVDAVRQLRGECGPRQIRGLELVSYATLYGDAMILRR